MKKIFFFFFLFISLYAWSADPFEVYPSHWWIGMKTKQIQIMVRSKDPNLNMYVDKIVLRSSSSDLKILKIHRVENRHYLIFDALISATAKSQTFTISFGGIIPGEWQKFQFQLKERSKDNGKARVKGVTSEDFVYLLMPDRFSNGDPTNDAFDDMRDKEADRNNKYARHGGDAKGIENHLTI